jgi:hypothetical protein
MATIKQKTAIKKTCENLRKNKPVIMGDIMLESGYSKSVSKHPDILTKSKAWNETIKEIDFSGILKEIEAQAFLKNNEDKDNCFKNKELLLKIGDKFPAQRTKVQGLFADISSKVENAKE